MIVRRKKPFCYVNTKDRRAVIQHLRDLANVGHLLDWDPMTILNNFKIRLRERGWGKDQIAQLEQIAYSRTIWEMHLERIRSSGNWFEYIKNKGRMK